jgi:hypothetical protein
MYLIRAVCNSFIRLLCSAKWYFSDNFSKIWIKKIYILKNILWTAHTVFKIDTNECVKFHRTSPN